MPSYVEFVDRLGVVVDLGERQLLAQVVAWIQTQVRPSPGRGRPRRPLPLERHCPILVSRQPPYGCGDLGLRSVELRTAIRRVKPNLVIWGHTHDGFGGFECEGTVVYNVSAVDEQYRLVREATTINFIP